MEIQKEKKSIKKDEQGDTKSSLFFVNLNLIKSKSICTCSLFVRSKLLTTNSLSFSQFVAAVASRGAHNWRGRGALALLPALWQTARLMTNL